MAWRVDVADDQDNDRDDLDGENMIKEMTNDHEVHYGSGSLAKDGTG